MTHQETHQQSQLNPLGWGGFNPQFGQGQPGAGPGIGMGSFGLGQAAFGQPWGQFGTQPFGQSNIGWGQGLGMPWGYQQRQLSQPEVGDVVRQLLPLLPQLIAQAQMQPQAAFGYNPFGYNPYATPYGQQTRTLTPQDVNEVVRQILPLMPQIVGMLQSQSPFGQTHWGQWGLGQALIGQQNPFGQQGLAQQPYLAAFGGGQSRQLSPQDINEVCRQLIGVIPQVIGSLQAGQQRLI